MKEEIKDLRVKIDAFSFLVLRTRVSEGDLMIAFNNSKQIERAYDSLILAKAWLGKLLGVLGEKSPYQNDGSRKTVNDIEPTADKGWVIDQNWFIEKTRIEKIDWLREEIKNVIDNSEDFSEKYPEVELEQGFVYKYLSEARFWLGFELAKIKNDENE